MRIHTLASKLARRRDERGQNLVEFALVLPVLLLIIIGGYNLGLLWLRISDADFIAQSTATAAARYGGYSAEVQQAVDTQLQSSFLAADRQNFSWRLETNTPDGGPVCGGGPVDTDVPGPRQCRCNWGERVTVITTYHWRVDALSFHWQNTYTSSKSALCWRGVIGTVTQ